MRYSRVTWIEIVFFEWVVVREFVWMRVPVGYGNLKCEVRVELLIQDGHTVPEVLYAFVRPDSKATPTEKQAGRSGAQERYIHHKAPLDYVGPIGRSITQPLDLQIC